MAGRVPRRAGKLPGPSGAAAADTAPQGAGSLRARVKFLLDTDTISFALRGQGAIASELRRRSPAEICTSSVVVGELELGVARRRSRKLRRQLDGFYTGLEVLPYDVEAARRYGRLAAVLLA